MTLIPSRRIRLLALRLCLAQAGLVIAGCHSSASAVAPNPKVPPGARSSGGLHADLETDKGTIEIEFFPTDSPKAVENFRLLAEHGYYNGLSFIGS